MTNEVVRNWMEDRVEIPPSWRFTEGKALITFGTSLTSVSLQPRQLESLKKGNFPQITGLERVPHCGIEANGYAEYLLDLQGLDYWLRTEPLRFKVGSTLIRVGRISPGLALLFEATYRSSDYSQKDFFETYSSIQLEGSSKPQKDALSALFYLNSDYLKRYRASASIFHLVDPSEPNPFPAFDVGESLIRKRVRVRKPIDTIEAISLYNYASNEWGESSFLGYYRVLEFFFFRGALAEFGRLRRDPNVSDSDLLISSKLDKELPQLKALLKTVLTSSEGRRLVQYVLNSDLAKVKTLDDVALSLYGYRNGLVHAKEVEILKASIPTPFTNYSKKGSWNWVAEMIAYRAIRRLSNQLGEKVQK